MPTTSRHSPPFARAAELAANQGGVVSRRQLYALGITRWQVRAQVRADRWRRVGDQSVQLHNGNLSMTGHHWAAVFQGGPRACLDGEAALVAAGLRRWEHDRIRVSVPRGARVRRTPLYDIRQTRRWDAGDIVRGSRAPARTRTPVAAVRAGLWARTDKQATLVVTMVVQQGLATPQALGHELLRIRSARRRMLLHAVVNDLLDGARSLGELDVVRELRRRGLPLPRRQQLRRDARGRYYLDMYWPDYKLVVEVDGIHHAWSENVVADALRQNVLSLADDTVLRLPLLGLRLQPGDFFDQIADGLRAGGWRPTPSAA